DISRYQQYFHYSVTNWLPFYWRGYSQTTRYTYVIENTSDLETIYLNFNSNVRKNLRKAEKHVDIKEDLDIKEFYYLNKMTFERQGLKIPYSLDLLIRLDRECGRRNARKIYYSIDKEGNIHSSIYFVWDDKSVYYLMSGTNPKYKNCQSLTLLIYEGIKLANNMNKKFDFEGSMKENIEKFIRQFGGIQKPYHNIYKEFYN
ncbi:MAG: GNAT family N-acetyltransferase, partial [Tissierellia bacterium]|nr:GNAT family N-acetyltransferase [Tissierellia bacterium]